MTMGVAGSGRRNGGWGWLPRWPGPSRGGRLLAWAVILIAGLAGSILAPASLLLALLPAIAAMATSRYGAGAGFWTLALALAAWVLASAVSDREQGRRVLDPFALAASAVAGIVVVDCVARHRAQAVLLRRASAALERERDARCTLLVELGHRVRNDLASLQASASLLSIGVQGAEAQAVLADMTGRIRLFGCIYRRLGAEPYDDAPVAMRAFLEEFCAELREVHLSVRSISLDLRADEVSLPSRRAVLIGLILNEGITNALKHAFTEGRKGQIAVRFTRDDTLQENLTLSVADDGIGLPSASVQGRGLGTRLLGALASQLDGSVAFGMEEGRTVLRIRFSASTSPTAPAP